MGMTRKERKRKTIMRNNMEPIRIRKTNEPRKGNKDPNKEDYENREPLRKTTQ